MKIKTITCHHVYNAGASLQAYALAAYLKKLGHEVQIIDYIPDYLVHYKLTGVSNPVYDKPVVRELYNIAKLPGRLAARWGRRKKAYDCFTSQYLPLTERHYASYDELQKYPPEADVYIAGSDQIWNSFFKNGRDPAFYLQFAPQGCIRASYAASFSTETVAPEYQAQTGEWLRTMDLWIIEVVVMKLIDYLLKYYAYDIGCRSICDDAPIPSEKAPGIISVLRASERYWYADPFGFEWNNKLYIFLEIMDACTGKGTIGVTEFQNGRFTPVKQVLEEPFHLSYPNVFFCNGQVYMIPETCHASQIRLYRAVSFPDKWILEKVLAENTTVVDTSFLRDSEEQLWLYAKGFDLESNQETQLRWFQLDTRKMCLTEVTLPKFATQRPGGNAFVVGGEIYRPLQDCSVCYGEKVLLYRVNEPITSESNDTLVYVITPKAFRWKGKRKYERIHTLNRTQGYEIIDLCYRRVYPTKPLRRLLQIIKKAYH